MILTGRRIVAGLTEGVVLASGRPISLLGGVDATTGMVRDSESEIQGQSLAGRVLTLPHGKGSTVGSYVLYGLRKRALAPSAIVASRAETVLTVGAVLAEIPMIDGVVTDVLRTGDHAAVDGAQGTITVFGVRERAVVSCFLEREGRVLVVRRSEKVGSFQGKWSGISGFLESLEDPQARALREIEEETGLREVSLLARGPEILSRSGDTLYRIHPFRFHSARGDVRLDWENVEYRWVDPEEIAGLDGVPKLTPAYRATVS